MDGSVIAQGQASPASAAAQELMSKVVRDAKKASIRRYDVITAGGTANLKYDSLGVAGGFTGSLADGSRDSFILQNDTLDLLLDFARLTSGSHEKVAVSVSMFRGEIRYVVSADTSDEPLFDLSTRAEGEFCQCDECSCDSGEREASKRGVVARAAESFKNETAAWAMALEQASEEVDNWRPWHARLVSNEHEMGAWKDLSDELYELDDIAKPKGERFIGLGCEKNDNGEDAPVAFVGTGREGDIRVGVPASAMHRLERMNKYSHVTLIVVDRQSGNVSSVATHDSTTDAEDTYLRVVSRLESQARRSTSKVDKTRDFANLVSEAFSVAAKRHKEIKRSGAHLD